MRVGKKERKCRKIYANKDFVNIKQIIVYLTKTTISYLVKQQNGIAWKIL